MRVGGATKQCCWLGTGRYFLPPFLPQVRQFVRPVGSSVHIPENFDGVTPPALPPGWEATDAPGPPPFWETSNSGVPIPSADSLPNAAFIDDPVVVSDKRLDLPNVGFFEGLFPAVDVPAELQFRSVKHESNLGFDGGVLELSTDGGNTFQDVLRPVETSLLAGTTA